MAAIFISHASADDALVDGLGEWLRQHGFDSVFVDHQDIHAGEKWADRLRASAGAWRSAPRQGGELADAGWRITRENYQGLGGLSGMIEDAAERALRGISPSDDVPLPRREPLDRLLALGAETFVPPLAQINDEGEAIRRVAPWSEFSDEAQELLERFDLWRLVVKKLSTCAVETPCAAASSSIGTGGTSSARPVRSRSMSASRAPLLRAASRASSSRL